MAQGLLEAISPRENRPESEAGHSPLRMAKFKIARRLNYAFPCLHAVDLKLIVLNSRNAEPSDSAVQGVDLRSSLPGIAGSKLGGGIPDCFL